MQKIKDNLGLIFISLVTILYLWLACNLVINFDDFKALELNEKGDFLAGIFSPLAFLWLVYGYLQQGQELKQNTEALRLQAIELGKNVEAQNEIVKFQQQEQDAKHFSVQPALKYDSCSIDVNQYQPCIYDETGQAVDADGDPYLILDIRFKIHCLVNSAYKIKIINDLDNTIENQTHKIDQGNYETVLITLHENQIERILKDEEFNLFFHIEYFDVYGKYFKEKIRINIYQFDWSLQYAMAQLKVLND